MELMMTVRSKFINKMLSDYKFQAAIVRLSQGNKNI